MENNVPQELLEKWQKEAEDLFRVEPDETLYEEFVFRDGCLDGYINARKRAYLEMQHQLSEKDKLIEVAYKTASPLFSEEQKEAAWQQFKTDNNL